MLSFHPEITEEEQRLWNKIAAFQFDLQDAEFAFSDRLARENGWTKAFALQAIEEYKKFLFLICVSDGPLTPSDQVDQVWHLHLLYTRSYWIDLCKNTINREIHHGPTRGGDAQRNKFKDCYAQTLSSYKKVFQQNPPVELWPPSGIRFGEINFQRVNTHRNWIFKKPNGLKSSVTIPIIALLVSLFFIGAKGSSEVLFIGGAIVLFFLFIVVMIWKSGGGKGNGNNSDGCAACTGDSGCSGCSGCGGCGGCG